MATIRRPSFLPSYDDIHRHADMQTRITIRTLFRSGVISGPFFTYTIKQQQQFRFLIPFTFAIFIIVVVVAGFAYSIELDLFGAQLHRSATSGTARSGPTRSTRTSSRPPSLQFTLPLLFLLFALPSGLVQLGVA